MKRSQRIEDTLLRTREKGIFGDDHFPVPVNYGTIKKSVWESSVFLLV